MHTQNKEPGRCSVCHWFSDGFNDPHGSGWCHSEMDYVDEESTCPFWMDKSNRIDAMTGQLMDEPVKGPEGA